MTDKDISLFFFYSAAFTLFLSNHSVRHPTLYRSMCYHFFSPLNHSNFSFDFWVVYMHILVCVFAFTLAYTLNKVKEYSAPGGQKKSISVSLDCYCCPQLSRSAVFICPSGAKPAIAFEERQMFGCSYHPGCCWLGLSVAKGPLDM